MIFCSRTETSSLVDKQINPKAHRVGSCTHYMKNCEVCNKSLKPASIAVGRTKCYFHFIEEESGKSFALHNVERLKNAVKTRKRRRPRRFRCEMGYGSCETRGYCNGDC